MTASQLSDADLARRLAGFRVAAPAAIADRALVKAGLELPGAMRHEIAVRGRVERLSVLALVDARTLPEAAPAEKETRRRRRQAAASPPGS